jgi:acetoacetyl-CoA synthetase
LVDGRETAVNQPLWTPDPARVAATAWVRFCRFWAERDGTVSADPARLWASSISRPESFWSAVWDFAGVIAATKGERVLADPGRMPGARWFPDARLNIAENLLRRDDEQPAIIALDELGRRRSLSFAELRQAVARLARAMSADGVGPGDRVAAVMPNLPETVIGMLATASLGATWSSCSPDFGAPGILDRFGQIEPKLLIATTGYSYAGKPLDISLKLREVIAGLPSLRRVVLAPYLEGADPSVALPMARPWDDYVGSGDPPLSFRPFPFDQPLYVLYSSGTTGKPKAIVHGAGGTLLQHLKEHQLHADIGRNDRVFYFTTCGWMMWNWLVSGLASEATILLWEGSPFHPDPRALWRMAEAEGATLFGTSARYIEACRTAGIRPIEEQDLGELRTICSTGSPLSPQGFAWIYDSVARDVHLASISGGTDIVSCFVLGNPTAPVWPGEIQTRGLGMAVDVVDDEGRSLVGAKGELVCRAPFPSMPLGFWNDPDGSRYRAAYFERFAGMWHHGDFAEITEHDGIIIHGRSDAVLNPGGVRIGTAEIYRQIEQVPEVLESLCVGQDWAGDVRVVLFVRLREGVTLDDALRERIRRLIRENASPRHVPARIIAVADLPRTMNNKLSELAVREVIHGRPVKNTDALANPGSLELFRDLPELRG